MTEPLTPPDCDLKDFAYMPLDVARLRQSELTSDETPEACWAAVLLWCASWHEIPAASIPDNDQWQAKQCGYVARGKVDKAWESVRAGALRGFVKCADGRLYHPVVAEKARESWESKNRYAHGKMAERVRKANVLRTKNGLPSIETPTLDQWISAGRVDPVPPENVADEAGIPPEPTPTSAGIPPEKALNSNSKGEGYISPSLRSGEGGATQASPPPPPTTPKKKREEVTLSAYLSACKADDAKPVPDDHHIRSWAADAGITDEMLQVTWVVFRDRYTKDVNYKNKRYKDWPGHFANGVQANWFRIWFVGDDGKPAWSSVGMTHKSVLDSRMEQREGHHAGA